LKAAFLRGPRVTLGAPTRGEGAELRAMALLLASDDALDEDGPDRVLAFAARDVVGGALLGGVVLERVDWRAREALLALRWGASARALAADALALVVRYAFDELALARLRADPESGEAEALLAASGFTRGAATWSRENASRPFPAR
jgi:RimJ/RimL family protein N-acetyltransferase